MSKFINKTPEIFAKMIGHCKVIENNVKNTNNYDEFLESPTSLDATLFQFQQLGELAGKVPQEVKEKYKNIDFRIIYGLRNVVVHDYAGVNYDVIYDTAKDEISELKNELENILEQDYDYTTSQIKAFVSEYEDNRKFNYDLLIHDQDISEDIEF